jgi:hypothetical protein
MKKIKVSFYLSGYATQTYVVEDDVNAEELKRMIEEGETDWSAFAPDVIEAFNAVESHILATPEDEDYSDISVEEVEVAIYEEDGQE